MKRAARVDGNQVELVVALRKMGATVQHLYLPGRGCPDLLVGYGGQNLLFEIKDGDKPPSRRRLTPDEQEWHNAWRGQVRVVGSIDEALQAIAELEKRVATNA